MAKARALRQRGRWFVLATLVGAAAWYTRSRSAARPYVSPLASTGASGRTGPFGAAASGAPSTPAAAPSAPLPRTPEAIIAPTTPEPAPDPGAVPPLAAPVRSGPEVEFDAPAAEGSQTGWSESGSAGFAESGFAESGTESGFAESGTESEVSESEVSESEVSESEVSESEVSESEVWASTAPGLDTAGFDAAGFDAAGFDAAGFGTAESGDAEPFGVPEVIVSPLADAHPAEVAEAEFGVGGSGADIAQVPVGSVDPEPWGHAELDPPVGEPDAAARGLDEHPSGVADVVEGVDDLPVTPSPRPRPRPRPTPGTVEESTSQAPVAPDAATVTDFPYAAPVADPAPAGSTAPAAEDVPAPDAPFAHPFNGDSPAAGFGPTSANTVPTPNALFTPTEGMGTVAGPDGEAPSPEFTVKGNAESMIFHTQESPYYERTRAEVWFRSADEAIVAGFTQYRPTQQHTR